jgi:hypothetical protein
LCFEASLGLLSWKNPSQKKVWQSGSRCRPLGKKKSQVILKSKQNVKQSELIWQDVSIIKSRGLLMNMLKVLMEKVDIMQKWIM